MLLPVHQAHVVHGVVSPQSLPTVWYPRPLPSTPGVQHAAPRLAGSPASAHARKRAGAVQRSSRLVCMRPPFTEMAKAAMQKIYIYVRLPHGMTVAD